MMNDDDKIYGMHKRERWWGSIDGNAGLDNSVLVVIRGGGFRREEVQEVKCDG